MLGITQVLLALTTLASPTQMAAAPVCSGAATAIATVRAYPPTDGDSGINLYRIGVTVENVGAGKQAGNTLDSVVMYQQGVKTDVKGLRPLAAGASQTVIFSFQRSTDAGRGTTKLRFRVASNQPNLPRDPNCNAASDTASTTV